jgi:hypothetical protein
MKLLRMLPRPCTLLFHTVPVSSRSASNFKLCKDLGCEYMFALGFCARR